MSRIKLQNKPAAAVTGLAVSFCTLFIFSTAVSAEEERNVELYLQVIGSGSQGGFITLVTWREYENNTDEPQEF